MSAIFVLTTSALGILTLYGYGSGREMPYERMIYGTGFCTISAIALLSSRWTLATRTSRYASIWMALALLWLFSTALQTTHHPRWILGDLAGVMLPASLLICGTGSPQLFGLAGIRIFAGFHLVGAILAPLLFHVSQVGDRYETPHYFLFTVLWLQFARTRSTLKMLIYLSGIVICGVIAFFSMQRTNVLLLAPIGLGVILLRGVRFKQLNMLAAATLAVALAAPVISNDDLVEMIQSSRFTKLKSGFDDSTLNRWYEVQDVWNHIQAEWQPWQYVFGEGHGASFPTMESRTREENYSAAGTLHNIHVGPILIFFRYGMAGVLLALIQIGQVLASLSTIRHSNLPREDGDAYTVFVVAFVISVLYGCLYPVLPSPTFSFIWSGVLFYSLRPRGARSDAAVGDNT